VRSRARRGAASLLQSAGGRAPLRLLATSFIFLDTRAERPSLLEYTWETDLLRWSLLAVDSGTRLTLEHTVSEPDWLPRVAAGWHLCLDVAERLLDGSPVPPIRGEAAMSHGWERLHETYAELLQVDVAASSAD
jgi:hypothetical protein